MWTTTSVVADLGMNPTDGTLGGNTQTSRLPLSSVQLVKLKKAGNILKYNNVFDTFYNNIVFYQ